MPHFVFFCNDTATTEIYTLSLHDALPISPSRTRCASPRASRRSPADRSTSTTSSTDDTRPRCAASAGSRWRSEEHTSELQSRQYLVCRLLLEKNKKLVELERLEICCWCVP